VKTFLRGASARAVMPTNDRGVGTAVETMTGLKTPPLRWVIMAPAKMASVLSPEAQTEAEKGPQRRCHSNFSWERTSGRYRLESNSKKKRKNTTQRCPRRGSQVKRMESTSGLHKTSSSPPFADNHRGRREI